MTDMTWISWDDVTRACHELAKRVSSKQKVTKIIAISKGGLIPGRILCDILGINDLGIITVRNYYPGTTERLKHPFIRNSQRSQITSKDNVLLVDEILDSGKTLQMVLKRGFTESELKHIKVCVLYSKVKEPVKKLKLACPVYYDSFTSDWLVFPWDKYEYLRMKQ